MDLGLKKMPWWGQLALYAAIAVGCVAAHHYLAAVDMEKRIAVTHSERRTIEADLATARAAERRLPELRAEIARRSQQLESAKNQLPEQRDVGDLLRRVQTLATQSSLTIRGFKPQAVATKEQHAEWPISLSLEGTYHDLGAFFDKVSRMPRIINISAINIKTREKGDPSSATVSAECTVTTFVLSDAPPAAATARRPGGRAGARPAAAAR